jgi:hypothetical protein
MNPPREPDAQGIGAHLGNPGSSLQKLMARAAQLTEIQTLIRDWAGEPLASSLSVANERDGTLIIYAASAAALTQVRYKQQELIQFLHDRLGLTSKKIEVKIHPAAQGG